MPIVACRLVRLAAVGLLLMLLAGCSRSPDEDALRQTIAGMQSALEERSLSGVMSGVADDFGGSEGLDAERMKRLVQMQIIGNRQLGATIGPIDIELQGERATARFSVLLTGGRGGWLPDRGRAYRVESGWRIESGEWRVFYADWDDERD